MNPADVIKLTIVHDIDDVSKINRMSILRVCKSSSLQDSISSGFPTGCHIPEIIDESRGSA